MIVSANQDGMVVITSVSNIIHPTPSEAGASNANMAVVKHGYVVVATAI
jgi:hypothetical protein